MRGWNALRDRVLVQAHDTETTDEDDDTDGAPTPTGQQLVTVEESLGSRLTPDSPKGWGGAFIGTLLVGTLLIWAAPLIPPWFFDPTVLVALAGAVAVVVTWLGTRQMMLSYWEQFDQVDAKKGDSAESWVGKVDTRSGNDPLFKRLESVGFAGLSPTFETVDEQYSTETPLMSKIDRRNPDGTWDAARIRLDHAYTAETDTELFGRRLVTHTSDITETPHAQHYEERTTRPARPDEDDARTVLRRDEHLRTEVIPALMDRLSIKDEQMDELRQDMLGEEPLVPMGKMGEFIDMTQPTRKRTNGSTPSPEPAMSTPEDRAAERLEDENA
jgi:hypothetical protein